MINVKKIEELARQIHGSMPQVVRIFGEDIEKKIFQILQSQLINCNVINREEFDVQNRLLLCTRKHLALLEQRIIKLETMLDATSPGIQEKE